MKRLRALILVLCLVVMGGIQACSSQSDALRTANFYTVEVPLERVAEDVFSRSGVETTSSVYSTRATSLGAVPIDTEVVERLIRQRLRQVETRVLQDLISKAGEAAGSKPVRDLLDSISSLAAEIADGETRSQTLTTALLRNGIAFGIVGLVQSGNLVHLGCLEPGNDGQETIRLQADAAYEGLAASTYLKPLGFPQANGKVDLRCKDFAARVPMIVDTLARIGLGGQDLKELPAHIKSIQRRCDPKTLTLPLELSAVLTRFRDGSLDLQEIRTLRLLYARARVEIASQHKKLQEDDALGSPSGMLVAYRSCYDSLQTFASFHDRLLARLSSDTQEKLSMKDLSETLEVVYASFPRLKIKPDALKQDLNQQLIAYGLGKEGGFSSWLEDFKKIKGDCSALTKPKDKDQHDSNVWTLENLTVMSIWTLKELKENKNNFEDYLSVLADQEEGAESDGACHTALVKARHRLVVIEALTKLDSKKTDASLVTEILKDWDEKVNGWKLAPKIAAARGFIKEIEHRHARILEFSDAQVILAHYEGLPRLIESTTTKCKKADRRFKLGCEKDWSCLLQGELSLKNQVKNKLKLIKKVNSPCQKSLSDLSQELSELEKDVRPNFLLQADSEGSLEDLKTKFKEQPSLMMEKLEQTNQEAWERILRGFEEDWGQANQSKIETAKVETAKAEATNELNNKLLLHHAGELQRLWWTLEKTYKDCGVDLPPKPCWAPEADRTPKCLESTIEELEDGATREGASLACKKANAQLTLKHNALKNLKVDLGKGWEKARKDAKTAVDLLVKTRRPQAVPELDELRRMMMLLVDGRALRRGEMVRLLSEWLLPRIEKLAEVQLKDHSEVKQIALATLKALPNSIREAENSPAGVRLDVPVLVSEIASAYSEVDRQGWYLHATIGTGYIVQLDHKPLPGVYEELGFGWRCGSPNLSVGLHAIASGVLFQYTIPDSDDVEDFQPVFLGAGPNFNLYQLVEVSMSFGYIWALADSEDKKRGDEPAFIIGLQLPLTDYFNELTTGTTESTNGVGGQ